MREPLPNLSVWPGAHLAERREHFVDMRRGTRQDHARHVYGIDEVTVEKRPLAGQLCLYHFTHKIAEHLPIEAQTVAHY